MEDAGRMDDAGRVDNPGRVAARLARIVEIGLARVDLTVSQYRILTFLAGGDAQPSAVAEHLAVSRPSVTAVVDGLVSRGLVVRNHDKQDRRRVTHTLTREGSRLLGCADAALEDLLGEIVAHSPDPTGARAAMDGLGAWREALDAYRASRKQAASEAAQFEGAR